MLDLYDLHARRELLLERAQSPRLHSWWVTLLSHTSPDLEAAAFLAALTAESARIDAAKAKLRERLDDPTPWMSPSHREHYPELHADLHVAEKTKSLVTAAAWLGPWLDDELVAAIDQTVIERGGQVIYDDAVKGAWWADAPNSNWCAVVNGGLGFAAAWLMERRPDLAVPWLDRAIGAVGSVLDLASEEGAGIEGMGYWFYCFSSSMDLACAAAAVGRDELLQHPVWPKCSQFPIHFLWPDRSGMVNFGDSAEKGLRSAHLGYQLAALCGDGRAQWLADLTVGDPPRFNPRCLLAWDPGIEAVPPDDLPTCRLFPSVHLAAFRSSWDRDATYLAFKGGSNAWSHCHLDLNSFVLASRGEKLAIDPGPWPYTPDYWTSVEPPQSTAWHNTITVDGGDQRMPPRYRMSFDLDEAGDGWCALSEFQVGDGWASCVGDASNAYGDTLARFRRTVVFLPPDAVLILDDMVLREVRAQRHIQWLLHAEHPIEQTGDGIEVRAPRATLVVRPLLPLKWRGKRVEGRDRRGHDGSRTALQAWAFRTDWQHLWNVSPSRSPYPQWDPRGEPLWGPEQPFAVLLEATEPGAETTWTAAAEEGLVRLTCADGRTMSATYDPGSGWCHTS